MKKMTLVLLKEQDRVRLDQALMAALAGLDAADREGLSRARLQALIKAGHLFHEGVALCDPNHKARGGATYELSIPAPEPATPEAQSLPLHIVYEDSDLLVINKQAGLVVHPAAGNWDKTLVNALLAHCGESLSGIGGVVRPGIVHRLDKDTSGLMVVAKNDASHQALTRQFADRSLSRVYHALVWGVPTPMTGSIEGAIGRHPRARQKMAVLARGGKAALTHYRVLEIFGQPPCASLIECTLATGRTHQIRVHMAHSLHPVVGDPVYGRARKEGNGATLLTRFSAFPRQALHAAAIKFMHPRTEKPMFFNVDMPEDMKALLKAAQRV